MKFDRYLRLTCVVMLTGCSSAKPRFISDRERTESFKAYRSTALGVEALSTFLQHRTAMLVSGGMAAVAATLNGQGATIEFGKEPHRSLTTGQAVAIEADGYFLTAAHCVDYQFNYLVFSDGQTVKIAAPRVVAKIRDLATHRDIALLHVSAKLTEVFTWAGTETIRDRTPVVSVGSSELKVLSEKYASINRVCLAGCITSVKNLSVGGVLLLSNVPTRAGDSGGPIVDADGRLIAIHFGVRTSATTSSKAIAFRPDLSWVSSAIDEDRSRPRPSAEMILPQPAGANDDPVIMISLE